jgi:hypothetical protein
MTAVGKGMSRVFTKAPCPVDLAYAKRGHRLTTHPCVAQDQKDRHVAWPSPGLCRRHHGIHDRRARHLLRWLAVMRRTLELGDRVRRQYLALHQPRAEARKGGLADSHGTQRKVRAGHVIHPVLDRYGREVRHSPQPPLSVANENPKLFQNPRIG